MYEYETDALLQHERLSQAAFDILDLKKEELEGTQIYLELLEVRTKLTEAEKTFPVTVKNKKWLEQYALTIAASANLALC